MPEGVLEYNLPSGAKITCNGSNYRCVRADGRQQVGGMSQGFDVHHIARYMRMCGADWLTDEDYAYLDELARKDAAPLTTPEILLVLGMVLSVIAVVLSICCLMH